MSANPEHHKSEKLVHAGGRPRKKIDAAQFEELCRIQCTLEEIAAVFRVHSDTIQNWCKEHYQENFSVAYKRFSADGRACLRRLQVKWAEKNPTLALWLGKQWLGQTDKIEKQVTVTSDVEERAKALYELLRKDALWQDKTDEWLLGYSLSVIKADQAATEQVN